MGKRSNMPDRDVNLLLTSGLILLISLILAAMAYFSLTLGIIDPPGASNAPNRVGGTGQTGTGVANPGGVSQTEERTTVDVGDIIFPGFVDFSITDGRSYVDLTNSSANQVYFKVTLTDADGQVLYANDAIQPGTGERWQVTNAFDPGTGKHDLTVTVDAFGVSDDTPYNGIISTFTVDMG